MSGLIIRPANLDSDAETGQPILLGFLDLPSSIDNLKHDWYQRKAGFSPVKIRNMVRDMKAGDRMPTLVLGMRGDNFTADADGSVTLNDPVFVIDGLQRWMAAVVAAEDGCVVRLSIQVFFNTTEEFEIALFANSTATAPMWPRVCTFATSAMSAASLRRCTA